MRSMALWMCLLCIAAYTAWTQTSSDAETVIPSAAEESQLTERDPSTSALRASAQDDERFIYTKHARERMAQRGANDNEVEDTILTGEEVPARDGKQKFEKRYAKACTHDGKTYGHKQVEVVTAKEDDGWVIITVIADCKS